MKRPVSPTFSISICCSRSFVCSPSGSRSLTEERRWYRRMCPISAAQSVPSLLELFESSLNLKRFRSLGHLADFSDIVMLCSFRFVVVNCRVEERGRRVHTSFRRNLPSLSSYSSDNYFSTCIKRPPECDYLEGSLPFGTAWPFLWCHSRQLVTDVRGYGNSFCPPLLWQLHKLSDVIPIHNQLV